MKIEFDIISLLDTAGFVQGVALGLLLFILNRRHHKSTFFLGLFLILYAAQRLPIILRELDVYTYYPELYLLPLNFYWLLLPLFYVYTQQVSVFSSQKTKYWLLYPGIFAFLVQLGIFLLPYETKLEILPNLWRNSFIVLGAVYSWVVGIYNLKLLYHHRIVVRNCYSMIASKELQWARIFLLFSIIGSMLYMVQVYLIPDNLYTSIFYIVFDLTIIYWTAYHGVVQRNVLSLLAEKDLFDQSENARNEATASTAARTKELTEIMVQIDNFMINSESYIDKELTIRTVSEALKIHPKRISTAINTIRKQNFNNYVNQLRIKKAKILLKNSDSEHLSIEAIGNEVGFHSKSAFYAAFKKFTGTTPIKYKENLPA